MRQMARRHDYNLVWCLLPIHQRRSASHNTTTTQTIMTFTLFKVIGIVHYHYSGYNTRHNHKTSSPESGY